MTPAKIANTVNSQPVSNVQPTGVPTQPDIMAQFQDVALPEQVSQFPAIGWWLLGIISIIAVVVLTIALIKRHQLALAKRQALNELAQCQTSTALNSLLKRACLSYYPRAQVAALSGQSWLNFLLAQLKSNKRPQVESGLQQLIDSLYVPNEYQTLSEQQLQAAKTWISTALPPSSKQLAEVQDV